MQEGGQARYRHHLKHLYCVKTPLSLPWGGSGILRKRAGAEVPLEGAKVPVIV